MNTVKKKKKRKKWTARSITLLQGNLSVVIHTLCKGEFHWRRDNWPAQSYATQVLLFLGSLLFPNDQFHPFLKFRESHRPALISVSFCCWRKGGSTSLHPELQISRGWCESGPWLHRLEVDQNWLELTRTDWSCGTPVSTSLRQAGISCREEFGLWEHYEPFAQKTTKFWSLRMPSRTAGRTAEDSAVYVYHTPLLILPLPFLWLQKKGTIEQIKVLSQRLCRSSAHCLLLQAAATPVSCRVTEKVTLGLPAAGTAAGASDGPEFFNLFEVKTLMSQAGQESNVVRDPVTTPSCPATNSHSVGGTQACLLHQKSQFSYLQ